MWIVLLLQSAMGQTVTELPAFDAQLYRPSFDAHTMLWTEVSRKAPNHTVTLQAATGYAWSPLLLQDDVTTTRLLSHVVQTDITAGYTYGPLRLGLDLPVHLFAASDIADSAAGLGDLSIDLKGTLVRDDKAPVGLALISRVRVPTATTNASLGEANVTWDGGAIFDVRAGPWLGAINVGTRIRPRTVLGDVILDDQLYWRVGTSVALAKPGGLSAEVTGHANYASLAVPGSLALEGMLGGWAHPTDTTVLKLGVGTGFTRGIGSPAVRAVLSLGWLSNPAGDRDLDGIADIDDICVSEPEDRDGFEDGDGCADDDNDHDGFVDMIDLCPWVPEDLDDHEDHDGCPERDTVITVTLVGPDGAPINDPGTLLADASLVSVGRGSFEGVVPPGPLELRGSAPGFTTDAMVVLVDGSERLDVNMVLQAKPDNMFDGNIGFVHVKVVDAAGRPIPGAQWWDARGEHLAVDGARMAVDSGPLRVNVGAPGYLPGAQQVAIISKRTTTVTFELEAEAEPAPPRDWMSLREAVYFDTTKGHLQPQAYSTMAEIATILHEHPEIRKISVEGHADARGKAAANQALSEQRAMTVAEALIDLGIAADRMEVYGYGEHRPRDDREDPKAYQSNRRVDISVVEWDPSR